MERAFKIEVGSKVHKHWNKIVEDREQIRLFINDFFDRYGIESNSYKMGGDGGVGIPFFERDKDKIYLAIIPTKNDLEQFGKQLRKPNDKGACYFKKSSKVLKAFQQECIDNQIVVNTHYVDLRFYFKTMKWFGYHSSIAPYEDTWLVKVASDYLAEDDVPEGFIPMKLSEFHINVESLESK